MEATLQFGSQTLSASEIIPLINRYQLLPQLQQHLIIDEAIAPIHCSPEEIALACQQFEQRHQLTSREVRTAFCQRYGLAPEDLEILATRQLRIEKFKVESWGHLIESHFLKQGRQLERVIYSLIRTPHSSIAQELYFRLQEGEQSFPELAQAYSQGPEAKVGGFVGPVEMGTIYPDLARLLAVSHPGQLWFPQRIGEWIVIVRLEERIPAQLDEPMRQRLLQELFNNWLSQQLN